MKWVVLGAGLLALAGCKSSAERAQIAAQEDEAYCAGIGAKPGTDAHVNCRLQIRSEQAAAQRQRQARIDAEPAFKLGVAQYQQPTTCTTQPFLGSLQTTCR